VHLSAQDKKWDKIYIAVDIHNTIVYGNYNKNGLPTEYISNSKEVLQYLSTRKDIVLIIYTCSHPSEITKYLSFFKKDSIIFKYANENLDIHNDSLGCYNKKIYFNLLLEDKAGFNAETDWTILYEYIKNINFNYDN
jgi:hypothetical protein